MTGLPSPELAELSIADLVGKLLGYAYAYEQATRHRRAPQYFSTAPV